MNNIKQIGAKVYYCNLTGNVLKVIGDSQGHVKETTKEQDREIYAELKERKDETIELVQYEYGEYPRLSLNSTGCFFDLDKQELIFTYDSLPEEPQEPDRVDLLEDKISILIEENEQLKEVTKEQDKLLVDNTYKIAMLEMNSGGM